MNDAARAGSRTGAPVHGRIMIVDDDVASLDIVSRLLRRAGYSNQACLSDPVAAVETYADFHPDIVLLDLHMPRLGGIALLTQLHGTLTTDLVPVLILTGDPSQESVKLALSSGAKDFVAKPFEAMELVLRVDNLLQTRFAQLALRQHNDELELRVLERTSDLANAELATLQLLARAAEFRDDDTGRHTQRVGALAARLAEVVGCDAAQVELLRIAAPLHDIGKIGIPDGILLKPGRLTPAERVIMERHPVIGAEILSGTSFPVLAAAREIALLHHERWDGSGYPQHLRRNETPQFSRIVAVADVFDALRHDRPYRKGLAFDEVITMIVEESGRLLDPEVVEAFTMLVQNDGLAALSA